MKRTNKLKDFKDFKVDAILCSDFHLWEPGTNPPCRLDDHSEAQWQKIKQIKILKKKYNCDIFHAGDLFEFWKSSPELTNLAIALLPKMKSIAGQHDLPQHNIELIKKSSFKTLVGSKTIEFLSSQGNWEFDIDTIEPFEYKSRKIIIMHKLIYEGELPFPGCTAPNVNKVFKMFPKADLILSGDNHKTITATKGKQLLINPGSLTRHKASQADHKPCVFLYNAELNDFKIHYLKIKKDVISREHIEIAKHKEERSIAFIEKLKDSWDIGLSFEDNIEKAIQENDIPKKMQTIILTWMGL